ncbi:MAG: contractile injection system protein, VgrG/Pvc8 family [Chloroflexales bacterium]
MQHEQFTILIDKKPVDQSFYSDLLDLEVELDDDLAAQFRLRLAISSSDQAGGWSYLDDEDLSVWCQVTIRAGLSDGDEELISGYITHLRPTFDLNDLSRCTLEIQGMDGSVRLDREEKLKAWPNKTDSNIASEIFKNDHALATQIIETRLVHDDKVSTIIQRETDMQFLRRLAARNGFECYVEGTTGYFRPPQLGEPPQPAINQASLSRFSVEVNALAPANLAMWQIDRADKTVLDVSVAAGQQQILGKRGAASLLRPNINPALAIVGQATTGRPEMRALAQGLYHQAEWFVTGEGELNANIYGHVLKPRRTVTIEGVGDAYSGVYYVSHVTHSLSRDGYRQHFRVRRNALG